MNILDKDRNDCQSHRNDLSILWWCFGCIWFYEHPSVRSTCEWLNNPSIGGRTERLNNVQQWRVIY